MKTTKVKHALFMLIVLIIPLFLAELMGRLLFPLPTLLYIPSHNFNLIYELNPLYPGINSLGMRNDELDLSTLHDHFVIAVIGDSHTYSATAKREDSFPARLEYHLKALTGKKIQVLNFGVPGYNMHQELEVLHAKALKLKPDLLILQYCINDEHISNYIQPKYKWFNYAINQSVLLSRAWTQFLYSEFGKRHIFLYVERYFPDLIFYSPGLVGAPQSHDEKDPAHAPHPSRSRDLVPVRYHDFIGRTNLERDVKIFGQLSRNTGIPTLATGFIEEKNRNLYETSGFNVYSFFQIFRGLDMRNYGYDPANTANHFSERGSDFIGKALADFINANFTLLKNRKDSVPPCLPSKAPHPPKAHYPLDSKALP